MFTPKTIDSVMSGFTKLLSDLEALNVLHNEKVSNDRAVISAAEKRIEQNTVEAARANAIKAKISDILTV